VTHCATVTSIRKNGKGLFLLKKSAKARRTMKPIVNHVLKFDPSFFLHVKDEPGNKPAEMKPRDGNGTDSI
jgi:hypothetical protein